MRELRKDVEPTLESPKEELVDNIDEIKIEEVLMGLKGLKQEEVFSFLGKNNFTPAETEMTSAGFGNYDQLAGVDPADIEQLQLNFDGNFDGFQGSNGHVMPNGSFMQKNASITKVTDTKMKIRPDILPSIQKSSIYQTAVDNFCDWSARRERADGTNAQIKLPSLDFRRTSAVWPKCPAAPVTYSLADGYLENLREEEIVSTPMTEVSSDVIDTSNLEEEFKYPVNNTSYVIQSADSVEPVEVADTPKPIKLRIKRVENEEEVSTTNLDAVNDNVRAKSKRIRNPCTKRKFIETSPPPKKKRCTKKSDASKSKEKNESPSISKKKTEPLEEFEFPFSTTVHQDDDFVYPSLDLSDDDEEDIYSFSQGDDETWTPKIKMKINEVKTSRPTRDRKTKSAVAKCLEAAAMKRADGDSMDESNRRKKCAKKCPKKKLPPATTIHKKTAPFIPMSTDSILSIDSDVTGDLVIDDSVTSSSRNYTFNNLNPEYNVPSTSSTMHSTPSSSYSSHDLLINSSTDTSPKSTPNKSKLTKKGRPVQKLPRAKNKTKLVPPKTCKLIQTPPGNSSASTPATNSVTKQIKKDSVCSPSSSSCAEKKHSNSYVTKRGKPKKGMVTAKQRLGKILKMHKMFF
ncbi:uncharacterized protein LOC135844860 isoform X2 [Planococcus citri]|uniref:uncharacterized protein LOC135844860 isoform X2 n=1 Tax=Planococcus citri TaxID=170843 RepID=UPI0031F8E2D9